MNNPTSDQAPSTECNTVQNNAPAQNPHCNCCKMGVSNCTKHKIRSKEEFTSLINRLSRIEGQIRGIKGMIQDNAYCTDILVQVAASNAALNSFCKELLASHIKTCVADNIRAGNDDVIDELVTTLQKLMR